MKSDAAAKEALRGDFEQSLAAVENHLSALLDLTRRFGLPANATTIHVGLCGTRGLIRMFDARRAGEALDSVVIYSAVNDPRGGHGPANKSEADMYRGNRGIDLKHGNGDGRITVSELTAFQDDSFKEHVAKQWDDWLANAASKKGSADDASMTESDWARARE